MGPKMLAKCSKTAAIEVHLTSSVNSSVFLGLFVTLATCNESRAARFFDFLVTIDTCNEWRRYMGPKMLAKNSSTAALDVHLTSSVNSSVFLGLSRYYSHLQRVEKVHGTKNVGKYIKTTELEVHLTSSVKSSSFL